LPAAAINAEAREDVISGQYIWVLRTGRRDNNPTYKHLIAICRFFGVSPMYFFDESETDRGAIPAQVAVVLQDDESATWRCARPACRSTRSRRSAT
jgi:hypothetical protein